MALYLAFQQIAWPLRSTRILQVFNPKHWLLLSIFLGTHVINSDALEPATGWGHPGANCLKIYDNINKCRQIWAPLTLRWAGCELPPVQESYISISIISSNQTNTVFKKQGIWAWNQCLPGYLESKLRCVWPAWDIACVLASAHFAVCRQCKTLYTHENAQVLGNSL